METTPKPRSLRIVLGFPVLSIGLSTIFMGMAPAVAVRTADPAITWSSPSLSS